MPSTFIAASNNLKFKNKRKVLFKHEEKDRKIFTLFNRLLVVILLKRKVNPLTFRPISFEFDQLLKRQAKNNSLDEVNEIFSY